MSAKKIAPARLVIGLVAILLAIVSLVYSFTGNAAICGAWKQEKYGETMRFEFSPFGTITGTRQGYDKIEINYSISGDNITLSNDGSVQTGTYRIVDDTLFLIDKYRDTEILTRDGIAYMQVGAWAVGGILLVLGILMSCMCMKKTTYGASPYPTYGAPYSPAAGGQPYTAPVQQPYTAPVQQPYTAPVQQPYTAPVQQPYTAPVQQPYTAPVQQPYTAPVQQPYTAPVAPETSGTSGMSSNFISTFGTKSAPTEPNDSASGMYNTDSNM